MDTFTLKQETDFITITFDEVYGFPNTTCNWGGYDVHARIEIKSGDFCANSKFYTSTGEIFDFFQQLKECNSKLTGTAIYNSYEHNLKLTASYDKLGHIDIKGIFSDNNQNNNLQFTMSTDQTFIQSTIKELELIVGKYGDMKGIKK